MAKRRTTEQICIDLKKERSRLYSRKYYAKKKLKSGNLTKKQEKKWLSKISKSDNKISNANAKLFKCGKRYGKLKKEVKKVQNQKRYVLSKLQRS